MDLGYNQFSGRQFIGFNNSNEVTLTNRNPMVLSATLNLTAQTPTFIRNVALYGVGGGGIYHFRDFGGQSALGGFLFFFSSRRRHTSSLRDWSSDVCSSDLSIDAPTGPQVFVGARAANTWGPVGASIEGDFLHSRGYAVVAPSSRGPIDGLRSEERRVGTEWRCRWAPGC